MILLTVKEKTTAAGRLIHDYTALVSQMPISAVRSANAVI